MTSPNLATKSTFRTLALEPNLDHLPGLNVQVMRLNKFSRGMSGSGASSGGATGGAAKGKGECVICKDQIHGEAFIWSGCRYEICQKTLWLYCDECMARNIEVLQKEMKCPTCRKEIKASRRTTLAHPTLDPALQQKKWWVRLECGMPRHIFACWDFNAAAFPCCS